MGDDARPLSDLLADNKKKAEIQWEVRVLAYCYRLSTDIALVKEDHVFRTASN